MISIYNGEKIARYVTRVILNYAHDGINTIEALINLSELEGIDYDKGKLFSRVDYLIRKGKLKRNPDRSFETTEEGIKFLEKLEFGLTVNNNDWDGIWRIVSYDIPESKRVMRDEIRQLIKDLGMKNLQRSLWIYPYDCERQFRELETAYGQKGSILYLEVRRIEGERRLKMWWSL